MNTVLRFAVSAAIALLGSLSVFAQAATYNFTEFNGGATGLGNQLSVEVLDNTATSATDDVLFKFTNAVGIASSLTDIYFDNGTTAPPLLSSISIYAQSSGVSFDTSATPPNVPGWNTLSPSFSADQSSDSNTPGASSNGISAMSEYLTIKGTLASGYTYGNVLSYMGSSDFRIAVHVQSIGADGVSAEYLVNTTPVPEPETYAMLLAGLGLVGFAARRKLA